jgi:hypothetical protein
LWGQGLAEPLIAIEGIKINSESIKFQGANQRTLKITLPNDKISLIKFNISEEEREILDPGHGFLILNVIGKFQKNSWNGYENPQISLEDYEIVRKNMYDF